MQAVCRQEPDLFILIYKEGGQSSDTWLTAGPEEANERESCTSTLLFQIRMNIGRNQNGSNQGHLPINSPDSQSGIYPCIRVPVLKHALEGWDCCQCWRTNLSEA